MRNQTRLFQVQRWQQQIYCNGPRGPGDDSLQRRAECGQSMFGRSM